MPHVLIVITYLAGSAWGPQVSMQEFSTKEACERGRDIVMSSILNMNKTNLTTGAPVAGRKQLVAACSQK